MTLIYVFDQNTPCKKKRVELFLKIEKKVKMQAARIGFYLFEFFFAFYLFEVWI